MTLEFAVVVLLVLAALIGIVPSLRRAGARRALGLAAAIAAPALLYFVLFPPVETTGTRPLHVITAGAAETKPSDAAYTVALPGSEALPGIERVPDLATALRRHADASLIDVSGAGLDAASRDAAHGYRLQFDAAPLPRGIVTIEKPDDVRAGHGFALSGAVAQPDGLRIALREPGGRRRDPVALDADGRFAFTLFAPRAADVSYELSLIDAAGADVERVAVPVSVRDGNPLRLLLLSGGPDADLKYLQRWALDAGHTVDARISLSRGLSQQRGDASLTDAALAATDVAVLDERAWSQLDKSARTRLLAAVDAGMGLLLRLRSAPSATFIAQWRELGLPLETADIAPSLRLRGEPAEAAATLQRLPLRVTGSGRLALAQDREGVAVAAALNRGQGRAGLWWLYDTHALALSGQGALHDALWADAIDRLSRPRQAAAPSAPAQSWQDERVTLCAHEDTLHVTAPSGAIGELLTRRGSDGRWCGGFWPRERGWHSVQAGTASTRFFVYAADEAVALHRAQIAAATRALAGDAAPVPHAAAPGPRWPWFLAFVLAVTVSWWQQRRGLQKAH
jgi:hypothetical protein